MQLLSPVWLIVIDSMPVSLLDKYLLFGIGWLGELLF